MIPHRPELRELVARQRQTSPQPTREEQIAGFKGWHERGYLPHRDEPGLTQFVTFRLADSFPDELREQWEKLLQIEDDRERRAQFEAWLDFGHGACHLRDARIAAIVAAALRHFDGTRYRLLAWVVMPNHVHVLFQTFPDILMDEVVNSWKKFSATRILQDNPQLPHPLWQREFWDRYTRNTRHFRKTVDYIHQNPVKAGLVKQAGDWPWSTARCWTPFLG
jgi:type I restriction enzyme R subunit/putative DNA methylase